MKFVKILPWLTFLAGIFPLASIADSGLYIGLGLGNAAISGRAELPDTSLSFDKDDSAFKITGGYRLDLPLMFAAVEGAYVDFGAPQVNALDNRLSFDTTGFSVFGVAGLELGPVEVFGKLGGIAWEQDVRGLQQAYAEDGFDLGIGAGVAVGLGAFSIRGEYEYFDAGPGDLSMLSVGVTYLFD